MKVLTATDIGTNGAHQAGSLIPKDLKILAFFPTLEIDQHNPRASIEVYDSELGEHFNFNFIYYNGRTLGLPGKDEYRLTGMTRYLRLKTAQPGDELWLTLHGQTIRISVKRQAATVAEAASQRVSTVRVSGKWKTAAY